MTKRAGLYARVSTSGQTEENQLQDLRAVAKQRQWTVAGEFVDKGISGSKTTRPALDKMLAEMRRGRIDLIAVAGLDRLGRSTTHVIGLLEEFRRKHVEFVSLRENLDSATPTGRMVFSVLASVAELERELITDRVRAGLRRAKAQGVKLGRKPVAVDRAAIYRDHYTHKMSQPKLITKYGVSKGTLWRILSPKSPERDGTNGD